MRLQDRSIGGRFAGDRGRKPARPDRKRLRLM
jgi:hypothetical protein